MALFDNEEVGMHRGFRFYCGVTFLILGSESAHGASSNTMPQTLERIVAAVGASDISSLQRTYRNSFLISADMAHAVHPNYP